MPEPDFTFTKPPTALSQASCHAHSCSNCEAWHRRQRMAQHFPRCPAPVGSSRCHSWSTLLVALCQKFATSFSWLHERHPSRCMRPHNMRGSSPPFQMRQQLWGWLRRGPRATCQGCSPMTDSEIHPLDKSSVQSSRETQSRPGDRESGACPQAPHVRDPHQLAPPGDVLHLTIDQLCCHLPLGHFPPSTKHFKPLANMSRETQRRTHSSHRS